MDTLLHAPPRPPAGSITPQLLTAAADWAPAFWAQCAQGPGCRPWRGRRHVGYGVFYRGRRYLAQRLAYALAHGPVPAGHRV